MSDFCTQFYPHLNQIIFKYYEIISSNFLLITYKCKDVQITLIIYFVAEIYTLLMISKQILEVSWDGKILKSTRRKKQYKRPNKLRYDGACARVTSRTPHRCLCAAIPDNFSKGRHA
jgi:hypothetical protein